MIGKLFIAILQLISTFRLVIDIIINGIVVGRIFKKINLKDPVLDS